MLVKEFLKAKKKLNGITVKMNLSTIQSRMCCTTGNKGRAQLNLQRELLELAGIIILNISLFIDQIYRHGVAI